MMPSASTLVTIISLMGGATGVAALFLLWPQLRKLQQDTRKVEMSPSAPNATRVKPHAAAVRSSTRSLTLPGDCTTRLTSPASMSTAKMPTVSLRCPRGG